MSETMGYFVTGVTNYGTRFRPSDWAERAATVCGCFDRNCRLHYNPMLRPINYDGLHGLYIAFELEKLNPDAYQYAMDFSRSNQLQIIEMGMIKELQVA